MSDPLHPLPLAELRLLAEGRRWNVAQRIDGLDSLTPVQGAIKAVHHGTALEVTAEAETIVTLCCDRCLQRYNHALSVSVHELVELRGAAATDAIEDAAIHLELARVGLPDGDDLDDRLDPAGRFDPEHWLFEQLSLRLPLVNRCGDDCPGPARWSSEPAGGDPRWAALARLGLAQAGAAAPAPSAAPPSASGRRPSAAEHDAAHQPSPPGGRGAAPGDSSSGHQATAEGSGTAEGCTPAAEVPPAQGETEDRRLSGAPPSPAAGSCRDPQA